jgi:hypothetical protein
MRVEKKALNSAEVLAFAGMNRVPSLVLKPVRTGMERW